MGNASGTPAAKSVAVDMARVRADIVDIMASPEWMAGPGLCDQTTIASKLVRLAWRSAGANVVGKSAQGGQTGAATPPLSETSSDNSGRERTWSNHSGRERTWSNHSGRDRRSCSDSLSKDHHAISRTTTADTLGTERSRLSKTPPKSLSKTGAKDVRIPKRDQYIALSDVDTLEEVRELLAPVILKHPGLTYADLWSTAAHCVIERQ